MKHKWKSVQGIMVPGLAALMLAVAACAPEPNTGNGELFELGTKVSAKEKPALIERREIKFNPEQLQPGEKATIRLPVPEEVVEVQVSPVPSRDLGLAKGQAAWVGHTKNGAELLIMQIGKGYEARLARGKFVYRLRTVDGIKGVLDIYDATRFKEAPNDGIGGPEAPTRGPSGDSSCLDPADQIDVMVLYTPEARDASGGVTEIENEIAFTISITNLAYANSNATHRLNLIYTGLAGYSEPADGVDSNALLGDLQGTSDGVLDTVHGTRDSVKADLVSLLYEVDDSSWCGWGNTVENANADTTDHRAFSVVRRSCTSVNLSFPHELGHNLGAQHDRDNAGTSSLGYNFGHIEPSPTSASPWRTVMSYPNPCGTESATGSCQRVAWFSNPDVDHLGDATGVPLSDPEPEHNVHAFALNDGHVSRYRCLRKDIADADVWMKDRWEDTGEEPDPATAGQPMWQSPYIWVRHSEDTTLEHEHEHQDPQLGIDNHVYVKLHNDGGASQSGDVELYFAPASTNLNDVSSWTQIGSQSVTLSPGVESFHFTWSDLPGEGHYCLLARWNEDGSPLSFTNLGKAVRNDNDLIWRNVNIIDLGGDIDESAGDFMMAGDRRFQEAFLVLEAKPKKPQNVDWPQLVKVAMTIDPAILSEEKAVTQGLEPLGGGRYLVPIIMHGKDEKGAQAALGPFTIPQGKSTKVELDFEVDGPAVRKVQESLSNPAYFDITASQVGFSSPTTTAVITRAENRVVLGGVTFTLMLPAGE